MVGEHSIQTMYGKVPASWADHISFRIERALEALWQEHADDLVGMPDVDPDDPKFIERHIAENFSRRETIAERVAAWQAGL